MRLTRAIGYGLGASLLGALTALGVAEAAFRIVGPRPPVQVVRGHGLHVVDGVPLWLEQNDRENRACAEQHPERTRILFFGSSITFGSGVPAPDAFTALLNAELDRRRPATGFCVLNFAQPAFQFEQKYTVAQQEVSRYRPALIMWEDWVEWQDLSMIGGAAIATHGFAVRPDGAIGMAGVPDGANRFLLEWSRLYEYLTLTFGQRVTLPDEQHELLRFIDQRLIEVPRMARSAGAKLVMYLAPPLDRPFGETAANPPAWHRDFESFARANDVPVYPLERELIDQDYLAMRIDACCHYSAEGHRVLARVMAKIVLEHLGATEVARD